jgi:signal transduction histidine kinase
MSDRGSPLGAAARPAWWPRLRPFPLAGWIVVGGLSITLFWIIVPLLVGLYDLPLGVAFAVATLQCITLPLAVRYPVPAMLVHIVSIVVIGTLTREMVADEFWPLPIADLVALIVILVILGLRESWIVSVSAWWASFLAMTIVVALNVGVAVPTIEWGVDVIISVSVSLLALGLSIFIGQRRRVRELIAAARRDVELEQARRATVEERARIARELHDVVAHSMSMVHIQAESAKFRIRDLGEAREEFAAIAKSARAALGEMRQLLEALHPDDETYYAPQPSAADIPALVDGARAAGSVVSLSDEVDPARFTATLGLTAYRIVQEALSNVIRHAPGAVVDVSLRESAGVVMVVVRNAPPPSVRAASSGLDVDAGGRGLQGMRERVEMVHGTLEHGDLPGGGFVVSAHLPSTPRSEAI